MIVLFIPSAAREPYRHDDLKANTMNFMTAFLAALPGQEMRGRRKLRESFNKKRFS
jgi:hypothetical protein